MTTSYVSLTTLGQKLQMSPRTLSYMAKNGRLAGAVKVGRAWRVDTKTWQRSIEDQKTAHGGVGLHSTANLCGLALEREIEDLRKRKLIAAKRKSVKGRSSTSL